MAYDLRVSPETAPPSFEKGNSCLTCHRRWFVHAPFLSRIGVFCFCSTTLKICFILRAAPPNREHSHGCRTLVLPETAAPPFFWKGEPLLPTTLLSRVSGSLSACGQGRLRKRPFFFRSRSFRRILDITKGK